MSVVKNSLKLDADELVVKFGLASLHIVRGKKPVGGNLYLTNKRLCFRSKGLLFRKQIDVSLCRLESMCKGDMSNEMHIRVKTDAGDVRDVILHVWGIDDWLQKINKQVLR